MPVRIVLAVFDALCGTALVASAWLAMTTPAAAYVDPSVMTYTIQALAGVAVALSAVLGVVWRRARRWLLRALRIDENAGKVTEPAVEELPADADSRVRVLEATAAQAKVERAAQGIRYHRPLAWRERLALALVACLTLSLTLIVVAPLEVVVAGSGSLVFNVTNVWLPLLVMALAIGTVAALALSAVRGRAFDVLLALVAAAGICALVQEISLNQGLPLADGTPVAWEKFGEQMATSGAVWLAVLAVLALVSALRPVATRVVTVLAAIVLVTAQGAGLAMLVSHKAADIARPVATEQGLTEVSPKSNVIVFVLDTLDTRYMDQVIDRYPDATQALGGFTYFHNSVGSMIPTRYGVPFLVTGHELDPNRPAFDTEEVTGWFSEDNLLDDAARQGYSVGVYSDTVAPGLEELAGKTMNVRTVSPYLANPLSCLRVLGATGLYRDLPWALKPLFWFTTDQLNEAVVPRGERAADETPYAVDDPNYRRVLDTQHLTATDGAAAGSYRVIHLMGSHSPYLMDENANTEKLPQDEDSMIRQSMGSLRLVDEYIQQLKDLGVYDQTTLIVTADHGVWPWGNRRLPKATSPLMLVKPAGADTSVPMQVSEAPTGHLDLPATIREALGAEAQGPTVFDVPDAPRERTFYWTDHDGKIDHSIIEWKVDGDALDFSSWHETGRSWPVNMQGYREGDVLKE